MSSGFTVAAEGIESEEQLARVRAAGCDEWQGSLYSEPLEAEAFSALLTRAAYATRRLSHNSNPCLRHSYG